MNREAYKKAMSCVRPSAGTRERIMAMTEEKRETKKPLKPLLIAALIAALLAAATLSVNAVTGGALFDRFRVLIGGEEADPKDYVKKLVEYTDEDGDAFVRFAVAEPTTDGGSDAETAAYTSKATAGSARRSAWNSSPTNSSPEDCSSQTATAPRQSAAGLHFTYNTETPC